MIPIFKCPVFWLVTLLIAAASAAIGYFTRSMLGSVFGLIVGMWWGYSHSQAHHDP